MGVMSDPLPMPPARSLAAYAGACLEDLSVSLPFKTGSRF
jgi:hypothetical protein